MFKEDPTHRNKVVSRFAERKQTLMPMTYVHMLYVVLKKVEIVDDVVIIILVSHFATY